MNIALFGGSFNPPHRGHAEVLGHLASLQNPDGNGRFDEIWILPTHIHPFDKSLLPFATRMELCQIMLDDIAEEMGEAAQRIGISDIECKLPGENRTIHTLEVLREKLPEYAFTLVLGSDIKRDLAQWKDFVAIEELAELYFIPRQGFEAENKLLEGMKTPFAPEISSSAIRQALAQGRDISQWVTPGVARFLAQNCLYSKGA